MLWEVLGPCGRGGRGDPVVHLDHLAGAGEGHRGVRRDRQGAQSLVAGQLLRQSLGEIAAAVVQLLSPGKREDLEAGLCVPQQLLVDIVLPASSLVGEKAGHALWFFRDTAA